VRARQQAAGLEDHSVRVVRVAHLFDRDPIAATLDEEPRHVGEPFLARPRDLEDLTRRSQQV
jgi:hypothetical protein